MNDLKYICPKDECTGCMACLNICTHSAIGIITDKYGFRYPVVNTDKCVECGLCSRVCPQINKRQFRYPQQCFATILNDDADALSCASGGMATALARTIIRQGGIVVGCSGEDMLHIKHIIVDTENGLNKLKGSKYVQSEIPATLYKEIRAELSSGRKVLFIGTGCQVAGLQNFLIKEYDNLYTVDLVCHGVPSQQMLNDDLALYNYIDPNSLRFRIKKKNSESDGGIAIRFGMSATRTFRIGASPKPLFIKWYKDPYLGAFMACVNFRESCYKCLYAQPERQSDITICDFWGLKKDAVLAKKGGASAALINTSKGQKLFDESSSLLITERREVEEAIKGNGQLQHPSPSNPLRQQFMTLYLNKGITKAYQMTVYKSMRIKSLKDTIYPKVYPYLSPIYKPLKKLFRNR